jgi:hypothetical protein
MTLKKKNAVIYGGGGGDTVARASVVKAKGPF